MTDPELDREALALFDRLFDVADDAQVEWISAQTAGRPDLRDRLQAMRDGHRLAALQTGGAVHDADVDTPPERIGAYGIVSLIGRGGMGAVYRGERAIGDFAHVVAIKLIRPGLLAEALAERFAAERATLAGLRHPNIAQLYDGGEIAPGAPYLVMEYVDGLPLMEWVAAQGPSRATRQQLFLDICAAVAFAHGRLIIHRDLTPSNVLVTHDGTVKLIDFGIARPTDVAPGSSAGSRSSLAGLSLTPGYAAPERVAGGETTTAIDIYSLGRLLERLIPPASGDRDLRAIIGRATANAPQDRYATANALRQDVLAWMPGMPVAAVTGGRGYVLGKFAGRHRLGVAAGVLTVVLLLGALALTLSAYARAERARAAEARRFAQTRSIAKAMLTDVYDQVSRVPGATMARLTLARTSLTYLDALARDPHAPADVRAEAGAGFVRLSQVVGGGQQSQLGHFADANTLLAKAERILVPLYRAFPDRPDVIRAYATLLIEQSGANLYNNNQPALARRQAAKAERLLRPTAMSDADDARRYSTAIQAIGDSWGWQDDYARARQEFARAERFQAALPAAIRTNRGVMMARSANLRLWGEAAAEVGDKRQAVEVTARAVAINEALFARTPNDPTLIRKMAISLWGHAVALRAIGRTADASQAIGRAAAFANRLRQQAPDDAGALNLLAAVGEVDAQVQADLGHSAVSYARMAKVIATDRRLVANSGDSPGAIRTLAAAMASGAAVHQRGGDNAGACTIAREAIALLERQQRAHLLTETDEKGALADARRVSGATCPASLRRTG